MDVYIYHAALLCEVCGGAQRKTLPTPTLRQSEYDSDDYPKGPYPDGGGEADCPQHCDHCGAFLGNPLTSDGLQYVREAVARDISRRSVASRIWAPFYDVPALTTKQLFRELAPDYSPANDPWGHVMGVFFTVADELYERTSGGSIEPGIPLEWGFRRGMAGYQETDSCEYETLQEINPSTAELYRLGCFLHRLTGRLERAGRSY